MTRAAERLIIAGYGKDADKLDKGCWWNLASEGLQPLTETIAAPWSADETIRRFALGSLASLPLDDETRNVSAELEPWLVRHPASELTQTSLRASSVAAPIVVNLQRADKRRLIGRISHMLLQHLPSTPRSRRPTAAEQYLKAKAQFLSPLERTALISKVIDVLDHPDLSELFGPHSRAEVAVAAGENGIFAGRIDRLAVTNDCVWIADFKGRVGVDPTTAPQTFVRQLALYRQALRPLYPALELRAFLVSLVDANVIEVASLEMDQALES